MCSIGRLVACLTPTPYALFDLSWTTPTPTGLATIEVNLAAICAPLPVFWPVLDERWCRIFVTYEVRITREYGIFIPRKQRRVQPPPPTPPTPQTASSDRALNTGDPAQPPEWNPYVGDAKTGLGESDTVVESLAERRPIRQLKKEISFLF